ncbi:hypothetical protein EYF80_026211 [Liparis tanakae]|uniref:Uncharacterized protein n=1 Tax=Liparis tanakae TaxID=230148 RepID=A0A4Z2HCK4_9TELE|nr:hypothetical protein EYF80_026211 [Liparis tanakae]
MTLSRSGASLPPGRVAAHLPRLLSPALSPGLGSLVLRGAAVCAPRRERQLPHPMFMEAFSPVAAGL